MADAACRLVDDMRDARRSGWRVGRIATCAPTQPTPPAEDAQPPARAPMRPDGRRPHSRIVELPGVVSLPVAEEASEEDAPRVAQADAQPETSVDDGGEGATDVDGATDAAADAQS